MQTDTVTTTVTTTPEWCSLHFYPMPPPKSSPANLIESSATGTPPVTASTPVVRIPEPPAGGPGDGLQPTPPPEHVEPPSPTEGPSMPTGPAASIDSIIYEMESEVSSFNRLVTSVGPSTNSSAHNSTMTFHKTKLRPRPSNHRGSGSGSRPAGPTSTSDVPNAGARPAAYFALAVAGAAVPMLAFE